HIEVAANLVNVPTLRLLPGQALFGADASAGIRFSAGEEGVQLSADNQVENLKLATDVSLRAIFNDTNVENLGTLALRGLSVTGVVQILARDNVRGGHVEAHDVDIVAADARAYDEHPQGYGVE